LSALAWQGLTGVDAGMNQRNKPCSGAKIPGTANGAVFI
jgi:hypothetical protein